MILGIIAGVLGAKEQLERLSCGAVQSNRETWFLPRESPKRKLMRENEAVKLVVIIAFLSPLLVPMRSCVSATLPLTINEWTWSTLISSAKLSAPVTTMFLLPDGKREFHRYPNDRHAQSMKPHDGLSHPDIFTNWVRSSVGFNTYRRGMKWD
jgi:hypothetical protein